MVSGLGRAGEDAACRMLRRHGYKILQRNFSCRYGEVDIIALKAKTLVFVEVKTRSGGALDLPAAFVDYHKQKRIIKTAEVFLAYNDIDADLRFDVIEVLKDGRTFILHQIENAFCL